MITVKVAADFGPQISLTANEQQIFDFLLQADAQLGLGLTYRVAGGWVRDKLMGMESDDIDIAIDNMKGEELAERYRELEGHPALGKTYIVKENPDQSKHIGTATVEIYGEKIDFVNLREERYSPGSRIPEVIMATGPDAAEKDSKRRDLTINAMFYNINTNRIEDFVGGVEDIKDMRLRTPDDPRKTLLEDPLRGLRWLRFLSRYPNAYMDPSLTDALADQDVQEAYRTKVSPTRAGPELRKLMGGERPGEALRQLFETGMYRSVFDTPEFNQLADYKMDQQNPYHKHNLLDHTIMVIEQLNDIMRSQGVDDETRMLMNFAALLHDSGKAYPGIQQPKEKYPEQMTYKGHEEKSELVADEVLTHIGIGSKARMLINQIIRHHMIHDFPEAPVHEVGDPTKMPSEMGKKDRKAFKKYYEKLHNLLQAIKPIQKETGKGEEIPSRPYTQDEIAKLVFMHAAADARSKGEEELQPVGAPGALEPYSRHWENMQNYYDFWSTMKTMPGNEIQQLVEGEFAARGWEIPKSKAYIGYVVDKIKRAQATGVIQSREDSIGYIKSMMQDIQQKYSQPTVAWVKDNIDCVKS